MTNDFVIFAGTSNAELATRVAHELGVKLGACQIELFPDGEISVRLDEPVRGREVFVLQSTGPPVNEHLVELLAFADCCRRASAERITAVVPYLGYARADTRNGRRVPVTASMVADLMQVVGITFVTNTLPVTNNGWPQLHVVSIAPLIGAAIRLLMADGSLSELC
jgi:ribose-phosphate pyrophosphokinase